MTIQSLIRRLSRFSDYYTIRDYVRDKLKLEYVDEGEYAICYKFKNYVVKVACEDLQKLIGKVYKTHLFKMYAVPVKWIHPKGIALICNYVEINWNRIVPAVYKEMLRYKFQKIKCHLFDLHCENVAWVKYKGKIMKKILDYGCFEYDPDLEVQPLSEFYDTCFT